MSKTVFIGSDHAGLELKAGLVAHLRAAGHNVTDLGPTEAKSVDYPDFAKAVCARLLATPGSAGILVCGTGIGMAVAANKVDGIRAVNVVTPQFAELSREHNDANVIAFGQRLTGIEVAREALKVFLATKFEGGRHAGRVDKLSKG